VAGFDYTLLKKPEAYSDYKGTIIGRPLYPSEVHGNLIAVADAINLMLGPLTQAQFGSRVDLAKMWVPVNFVYVQFPGMSLPAELMLGTWTNISSSFAGEFFRAEGGPALAFGAGEQASQNLAHSHGNITGGMNANITHAHVYGTAGSISGPGSCARDSNGGQEKTNGVSTTSIPHTHGINAEGGTEARPTNMTIRIWRKTA
jgi:hypothetical protein